MHGIHTILQFLCRTDENHNAPQCSSGQSVPQHICKLGTSQIHDRSIFTSVILLNSDTRECFASFISDHVIPYTQQYLVAVCKTSAETSESSYCICHCLLTSHNSHTINYTIQRNMKYTDRPSKHSFIK